jgi:hypothetical protein
MAKKNVKVPEKIIEQVHQTVQQRQNFLGQQATAPAELRILKTPTSTSEPATLSAHPVTGTTKIHVSLVDHTFVWRQYEGQYLLSVYPTRYLGVILGLIFVIIVVGTHLGKRLLSRQTKKKYKIRRIEL